MRDMVRHHHINRSDLELYHVDKDCNPSVLELNIKLAIYWQDFRLVIRWASSFDFILLENMKRSQDFNDQSPAW